MANPNHLEVAKRGVNAIAEWRMANTDVQLDLKEADLRQTNLSAADLRYADLRKADLRQTNLGGANLEAADLRGAKIKHANLEDANLERAKLSWLQRLLVWADSTDPNYRSRRCPECGSKNVTVDEDLAGAYKYSFTTCHDCGYFG